MVSVRFSVAYLGPWPELAHEEKAVGSLLELKAPSGRRAARTQFPSPLYSIEPPSPKSVIVVGGHHSVARSCGHFDNIRRMLPNGYVDECVPNVRNSWHVLPVAFR